ncbi:transcriptional regulator with XRE-family HTH domain [Chryseobacterium bernardetii]|uniref:Transcriptional regulator with XRE-family HTH domain n=1 Tax=Chryseobacterium bernardetii TaxID=1241978 RepID=A0ACC6IXG5_9FLAO|nr:MULTISPECIES: LexA family transcriptional regulator [Chryseobacterium]MDR6372147.1 transcriptional regulator with XRE-family HTH domain [Chryseobacterium vietnamense]MDR6442470.1 transcriptional regulator with XRE-family HTH domain [Chryseobacterium bernardetii]
MSIFSENIRFLRDQKKISQAKISADLTITRERYAKYEDGRSEPPIEILLRISKYHKVSIDLLVSIDIRKFPLDDIVRLPGNKIILPVVVDSNGANFIEIVPQKASMGYLNGYSDPEYMENLQKMQLPFLKNGKFRAFLADGDSMPPFADQSIIIGEYVERPEDLKAKKEYIFVTTEGITYKTFVKRNSRTITVAADNMFYEPYDIFLKDVVEIWRYVRGILPQDYKPHYLPDEESLKNLVDDAKRSISNLEKRLLSMKTK